MSVLNIRVDSNIVLHTTMYNLSHTGMKTQQALLSPPWMSTGNCSRLFAEKAKNLIHFAQALLFACCFPALLMQTTLIQKTSVLPKKDS